MGPTNFPETSVKSYHSMIRKIQKPRRSHLHTGGSLMSRVGYLSLVTEKKQTNERRNERTNKQTNKQASKQASKQTNKHLAMYSCLQRESEVM
jgi:hypothetical protein